MIRLSIPCFAILLLAGCNSTGADKKATGDVKDSTKIAKTAITKKPNTANTIKPDTVDQAMAGMISIDEAGDLNKAVISKDDSTLWLTANINLDHRIFGYEEPDTTAKKMFLLSVFTSDVEGNPFKCPYGAYYQTSDMENINLKYTATQGRFVKVAVIKANRPLGFIYMQKKWIEFGN